MTPRYTGIIPPMITPLTGRDTLDVSGLEKLVEGYVGRSDNASVRPRSGDRSRGHPPAKKVGSPCSDALPDHNE